LYGTNDQNCARAAAIGEGQADAAGTARATLLDTIAIAAGTTVTSRNAAGDDPGHPGPGNDGPVAAGTTAAAARSGTAGHSGGAGGPDNWQGRADMTVDTTHATRATASGPSNSSRAPCHRAGTATAATGRAAAVAAGTTDASRVVDTAGTTGTGLAELVAAAPAAGMSSAGKEYHCGTRDSQHAAGKCGRREQATPRNVFNHDQEQISTPLAYY
jgi:hypothetical protein